MNEQNITDYIVRQQQGTLTHEEHEALRLWYEASEEHRRQYRDYCVLLAAGRIESDRHQFESGKEKRWTRLRRRMRGARRPGWWSVTYRRGWKYAAVFLVAFASGSLVMYRPAGASGELSQQVEVPLGAKSHVLLPDGSSVWLNAGSRISYGSGFGTRNRQVTLDGEGCFDVVKNPDLAFEVLSSDTRVKVLGTRFNVKAYSGDAETRVTLLEGRLLCTTGSQSVKACYLEPNQQVLINHRTLEMRLQKVNAPDFALWTQVTPEPVAVRQPQPDAQLPTLAVPNTTMRHTLFFDEEPFAQIVRDLGRAFNVEIEIADSDLATERFYGDFRNGETIYQILDIITSGNKMGYRIEKNKIIIFKN